MSLYIYKLCIKEDFGTPSGVCAFGGRIYTQERKRDGAKDNALWHSTDDRIFPLFTELRIVPKCTEMSVVL